MSVGNPVLCVRFTRTDYLRANALAAKESMPLSAWMRDVALTRAHQVISKLKVQPLPKAVPGTEQVCIRFRPTDYTAVRKAAATESTILSAWIRAAVVQATQVFRKTA